jgi:hypothetical protein
MNYGDATASFASPQNPNWGLPQEAQRCKLYLLGISKWQSWIIAFDEKELKEIIPE